MRFKLPLLRRPGSDPEILPAACSAPVPTRRGTGGSGVRRAGLAPARHLSRTRQYGPLCRDPSRLDARSPRTPRDARIHATGLPAGPLQRATHGFPCQARTSVALLVHLPGRCTIRGGDPRFRRWSGVSAQRGRFRPQRLPGQSPKAAAQYHRVTNPSRAACLADPLSHKARTPLPPPVTTPFASRHRSRRPFRGVVTGVSTTRLNQYTVHGHAAGRVSLHAGGPIETRTLLLPHRRTLARPHVAREVRDNQDEKIATTGLAGRAAGIAATVATAAMLGRRSAWSRSVLFVVAGMGRQPWSDLRVGRRGTFCSPAASPFGLRRSDPARRR